MKRAVITGGSGVVGSALIRELAVSGVELLILLREGSDHNERVLKLAEELKSACGAKITIRECSLEHLKDYRADGSGMQELRADGSGTADKPYDVFYHLSWGGTKGKDRYDPYIHNKNVEYALDAVALAKRLGCSLFVGTGSQAEYGRSDARLTEETVPHPENAYGIAKLCAGHMTREYARQLGIRHVWTRILSVYGPNDGEKTLVTYLVRSFLNGERPVSTAGEQVWDYLNSEDAARALHAVGDRGRDGATYLIASGEERPLREYILEIRDVLAPGAEVGLGEVPYGDRQVMHLCADISRIREDTGWKPEVTFAEGIRKMAEAEKSKNVK